MVKQKKKADLIPQEGDQSDLRSELSNLAEILVKMDERMNRMESERSEANGEVVTTPSISSDQALSAGTPDNKHRYLKMKRFTGDDESASGANWLVQYERTADYFGWPEQWKSDNLILHLDGPAHTWLCTCASQRLPWPEMKRLFERRFVCSKTDAWNKISRMRWDPSSESIKSYYDKMCILGSIAEFQEDYLVHLLSESMPKEFSGLIKVTKPKTLSEWIENMNLVAPQPMSIATGVKRVCAAVEQAHDGNESTGASRPKRRFVRRLRCFNCQSEEHLIADCPQPKKNRPSYEAKARAEPGSGSPEENGCGGAVFASN